MSRLVFLMRHGIAHPRGSMPEETRDLTAKGHRRMKQIARGLSRIRKSVDVIYSSPLLRCLQTAEYLSDRYDLGFQIAEELRPDAAAGELRTLIDRTSGRVVVCVGHEPTLSAMMCDFTGVTGTFELKKGGCYAIRDGRLEWMLSPRVLRSR